MTRPLADPPKTTVIIPAFNEEAGVAAAIQAVQQSPLVDEIIVVDDGSEDTTSEVARATGVQVLKLIPNQGKGAAMAHGVVAAGGDVLCFIDADLVGLNGDHVDSLVGPVIRGECDMCYGIFQDGRFWSDAAQAITPFLSGQRAMTRELYRSLPSIEEARMGAEVTLHLSALKRKANILKVTLKGVTHMHKEEKMGLVQGAAARAKMYKEVAKAVVKLSKEEDN